MSIDITNARRAFQTQFGHEPTVGTRAPGRVNIIGEHTDYNGGFVLPMAIARETVILARPRIDRTLHVHAANLGRNATIGLDRLERTPDEPWLDYVAGVAHELALAGRRISGADLVITGDVPIGAGLSSSASLEMATLKLFEVMNGFDVGGPEGATLGQRVENGFLGLKTGIMDQFIIRMGAAHHALFLDCRSLEYRAIPIQFDDAVFVIANTGVSRGLAASKYNERVGECQEAVRALRGQFGDAIVSLRDCDDARQLEPLRDAMGDVVYRRARHVVTENLRTQRACNAMESGDATALGSLMSESDHSLRDDYEVTCAELDAMTELARAAVGCFGSRMTGAGFGGCTVSLVQRTRVDEFCEYLTKAYCSKTGLDADLVISGAAAGAGPLVV